MMNMQKKLGALLLAVAMLLSLLTGCGSADAPASEEDSTDGVSASDTDTSSDTSAEEAPALAEVPDEARENPISYLTDGAMSSGDVVMTVNGVDVTADTYIYWLAYQYTYTAYIYAQYGSALDVAQTVDDDGTTIARSLAEQSKSVAQMNALLRAQAQEAGLSLSEEQQSALTDLEENYDANTLLFYGTNLETLQQAYTDSCLATNLEEHLFGEDGEMAPTDETLADFAEEQGTYTCRYILLATNDLDEDDEEGRESQRQLAEQLYNQLQEYSPEELEEQFTALQEEYNTTDGNTARYTFDNDDSLVSGFREKVAELSSGELGMTEETDYGYFVLLRLDTDLSALSEDYSSATYNSLISQWMDEADVTTTEPMDNLDVDAFYSRLIDLQDALSAELAAAAEDAAEEDSADGETDAAEDADSEEPVG